MFWELKCLGGQVGLVEKVFEGAYCVGRHSVKSGIYPKTLFDCWFMVRRLLSGFFFVLDTMGSSVATAVVVWFK